MFSGVGLMLFGVALPFLMILRLIDNSLWLSFLSYAASITGLVIAFLGLIMHVRIDRR